MLKGRGYNPQRERFIRTVSVTEGSVLQYPKDVTNGYYIMYSIYPHAGGIELETDSSGKKKLVAQSSETDPVADIALYMPGELSSESEIEWESGKSLVSAMGGTESIVDTLNQGLTPGQEGTAAIEAGKMALKGYASKIGRGIRESEAMNDIERLTGQIANSHSEQYFNGIGFRSFSFSYKFQPSSHDETNIVRDIIRQFRRNALPEKSEGGLTSFYPSTFEIEFITPHITSLKKSGSNFTKKQRVRKDESGTSSYRNPYMPRLKQLVCTGCNVTYGSGGGAFSSFKDGAPVEIDMELSFTETSKVYMGDVDEGY